MRAQVIIPELPDLPEGPYLPHQIRYSAVHRCNCGAGLAYPVHRAANAWACSKVLLGEIERQGRHKHGEYPFAMYEIKSEGQPSAHGLTTRPPEHGKILWRTHATCSCGHTWETEFYQPLERYQKGMAGTCTECGNTNGSDFCSQSKAGMTKPIESRCLDYLQGPDGVTRELKV